VGVYGVDYRQLTEHWDGTTWATVPSPTITASLDTGFGSGYLLNDVTCVTSSDCWAVGYYHEPPNETDHTLMQHWDGNAWTIVSSPNVGTGNNHLNGITCTSSSDCWAVGYASLTNGTRQTLIEHWDGTSWAVVISPNTNAAQNNVLFEVTCVSASDCWAVGYYNTSNIALPGNFQTLVERYDGTSWSIVSSPNTSATADNVLFGVTCTSSSDCWALGYYEVGQLSQTLIEHWDGTTQTWSIVSSPNASFQSNLLAGVTCTSASNCWATGYSYSVTVQTLIERWDGTSWSIVSSPNVTGSP